MKFKYKLIQVVLVGLILFSSTNISAGVLPGIDTEPPREAYVFLKKEIIYEVCIEKRQKKPKRKRIIKPKEDCRELNNRAVASGILIDHYNSPETNEKVSLILTAGHFCVDPPALIPKEFNSNQRWNTPKITSAEVFWKYEAYDYLGRPYTINKVIAKSSKVDLCLLESRYIEQKPIAISNTKLSYGDKILNVGTPYGMFIPPSIILDEGFYIGTGGNNGPMMMSDLVVGPGSSGSMVIQKQTLGWKLVGMVHTVILINEPPVGKRGVVAEPLLALGATLKQIKDFIKHANEIYIHAKSD